MADQVTPHDVKADHSTNKTFHDRISHAYDSIADSNEHAARELGERLLQVTSGQKVLELGFGTGNSIMHLAEQVGNNGHVSGLDVSDGMRRVAQKKVDSTGFSHRVELRVGDAVAVPWDNESFDAVFCSFTLELFSDEDIRKVLKEVCRVLKSDGRFCVVGMASVRPTENESFLERTYQWMHRHFPHIVDCRPIDSVSLLKANSFQIQDEDRSSIWGMPVAAVLAKKVVG